VIVARVILAPHARALKRHPWIFKNEVLKIEGSPEDGGMVDVISSRGYFVGRGYFNSSSKIVVRILTRKREEISRSFFHSKIKSALTYRLNYRWNDSNAFRVVYSESDGIPGLIVDKFGEYLIVQFNTLGIEKLKSVIVDVLRELLDPVGIYEKDDEPSRKREGLEKSEGWILGKGPELIPFKLNGLNFLCDTHGQKTGFFLDQRINAWFLSRFRFARFLDVFCYTGNFTVHCLANGGGEATMVDYSERALEVARLNLKSNNIGLGKVRMIRANAFDYLKSMQGVKAFDAVFLDPPSLAKSSHSLDAALRGYKELNLRALKLLKNGGLLATSSCTRIVSREAFEEVIRSAARDTRVSLKRVFTSGQPPDHPECLHVPETSYLKFNVYMVGV